MKGSGVRVSPSALRLRLADALLRAGGPPGGPLGGFPKPSLPPRGLTHRQPLGAGQPPPPLPRLPRGPAPPPAPPQAPPDGAPVPGACAGGGPVRGGRG